MITKTIDVEVDSATFSSSSGVPTWLNFSSGQTSVNMVSALLMLGSITVPHGFSAASPARYWSWVRYFSAISADSGLRIVTPFVDLDPHQRGILSDDFGVAISTEIIYKQLGGFNKIVDGRQFLLQNSHLMKGRPKRHKPAKVGSRKCPDFIIQDMSGKWHVLECKGTQTSTYTRNGQLNRAVSQKNVIQIIGRVKGERLATGLFIGNDSDQTDSHIKIIDPEPEPLIIISDKEKTTAEETSKTLSVSRYLGLAGLSNFSEEISLPPTYNEDLFGFISKSEFKRKNRDVADRLNEAKEQDKEGIKTFKIDSREFRGKELEIDIPSAEFYKNTGAKKIKVRQGLDSEYVHKILEVKKIDVPDMVNLSDNYSNSQGVSVKTKDNSVTIYDSGIFVSTIEFI